MLIYGIDPGFSGAWGVITHTGQFCSCGDMIHNGEYIDTEAVFSDMVMARDGQDCCVVVERVGSMPGQGVASTFKFGMAFGAAVAVATRFRVDVELIRPQVWKKKMGLSSDKTQSLYMARELWPNAPLSRVKDNGRAEALLIAEYYRRQLFCDNQTA
jgi:crossover junction endodeoxyribonuclease RuvC